ncbi:hypothetical protein RAMLITH_09275 [Ramlibacter sp. RBP-2]|uniref:Uncharacterized protein n=1 Tax=Ramlibacter lithotrophicus TaxID=2606681 RepID=A0A7X6I696_9BURK|nr:hypothetical protein [Ramlibacter lithotrophicus]NKE66010.1 hypothetical protein [Ramlibacter lithotrophicus]
MANRHQRVVVVAVLVEPVTPEVLLSVPVVPLPEAPAVPPVAPVPVVPVEPPVPDAPIELVPPVVPLAPAAVSVLLPVVPPVVPAVLLELDVSAVAGGGVVVLDEVAELPAPAPASSFLPQALSDRAPTMASAAAAVWVRDIFIRVTP